MANVEHSSLTGAALHEPKGIAAAVANRVYVSNGAGSGTWAQVNVSTLDTTAKAFQGQMLHVRDEKAIGTDGGTFTSGAWQVRTLQTVATNEISGASLASNTISLPAGTYRGWARAVASGVQNNKVRFRNTSDGTTVKTGLNVRCTNDGVVTDSQVSDVHFNFTIAGAKSFQLQHQCSTTKNTTGFGIACNFDEVEVYAEVILWKVA